MTDRLLKIDEVCDWLSMAQPTIWRWVAQGTFPAPLKLGRSSRWQQSSIKDWLDQQATITGD